MQQQGKIRIFLVEDSDVVREVAKAILSSVDEFEVIGEAAEGHSAVKAIIETRPDILVCDIKLPGLNGIEVLKAVSAHLPGLKSVILTSNDGDAEMFGAFDAGARGYLLKDGFSRAKLLMAIETVMQGSSWLDPAIAQRVLSVASVAEKLDMKPILSNDERSFLEATAKRTFTGYQPWNEAEHPSEVLTTAVQADEWDAFLKKLKGLEKLA